MFLKGIPRLQFSSKNGAGCFFVSLSGPPCHICSGCCASRLESVDRAAALFQEVFLHALTIPALNKWTTVAPSMTLVAAMQQCYDVVPQAFGRCFARGQAEESSDDSGGEDTAKGVFSEFQFHFISVSLQASNDVSPGRRRSKLLRC